MKKILIAEDDEASREIIVDVVDSMDLVSIQSSNGALCLQILYNNPDISLLIADIMMPELDGMMLIKILRGNNKFAQLPIIIISGVAAINEINHILELGPSIFLDKPVDTSELRRHIEEMLQIQ